MSYLKQTTRMGTWKARKLVKGSRASRTPGNKKGLIPPSWARYICRHNRSYKHEQYSVWNTLCNGDKIKWNKSV